MSSAQILVTLHQHPAQTLSPEAAITNFAIVATDDEFLMLTLQHIRPDGLIRVRECVGVANTVATEGERCTIATFRLLFFAGFFSVLFYFSVRRPSAFRPENLSRSRQCISVGGKRTCSEGGDSGLQKSLREMQQPKATTDVAS
jgi:hypothetical protein